MLTLTRRWGKLYLFNYSVRTRAAWASSNFVRDLLLLSLDVVVCPGLTYFPVNVPFNRWLVAIKQPWCFSRFRHKTFMKHILVDMWGEHSHAYLFMGDKRSSYTHTHAARWSKFHPKIVFFWTLSELLPALRVQKWWAVTVKDTFIFRNGEFSSEW